MFVILNDYSCDLSVTTTEYSFSCVCARVSVCACVCEWEWDNLKNYGSINLKLKHLVVYEIAPTSSTLCIFLIKI